MSPARSAVFLSYASQDAAVVRRIAEMLRGGGIEVWFDQQELRGGDAWDHKIRRQIRDCALFLPVISATTQARGEGYFRREWKLAVDRSHDMAEGVPFLLPIALDGVTDREALVPQEFFRVQWTRVAEEGVSDDFVDLVKSLLDRTPAALAGVGAARSVTESAGAAVRPGTKQAANPLPSWAVAVIVLVGCAVGVIFMLQFVNRKRAAAGPAVVAVAAVPAPAMAQLDPTRVALARFENLTGDPALESVARVLENELVRGLAAAPQVRVLPVDAAGRAAARIAAREAGAGAAIVGAYFKNGDNLELSAEILLTEQGEVFGTLGPMSVPAGGRGPGLTEFVERLTTGASNAGVTLRNPPARLGAQTYSRPWPRWPMAQRVQAVRALYLEEPQAAAVQLQALLAEAPELLKVKHDLARLLRDLGRVDEAQRLFRELLGPDRSRLAEAEVCGVMYDEALLNGDPDRALQAARQLLEIRPVGDAITQVVSCLWGQNRPAQAAAELERWWRTAKDRMPESARVSAEAGVRASQAYMHLHYRRPEAALAEVAALRQLIGERAFPGADWLEFSALGQLGREQEQVELVARVGLLPAGSRVEPTLLHWAGYQQALHAGEPERAARWLARAGEAWAELTPADRARDDLRTLGLWLHEARGEHAAALAVLDELEAKYPDLVSVVGARAVVFTAMGRGDEARPLVERLERWDPRNSRGLPAYWRARLAARAGEPARAVELLRQAVARGLWFGDFQSSTASFGRTEPEFAALRGFAPYIELLQPKE